MAKMVQAVNIYGPKVDHRSTAQLEKISEWISMRTGLNKSDVLMAFAEISDAILFYNRDGAPVKIMGVGTFTPYLNRAGEFSVNFRADMALKNGINAPGKFQGDILNKERIGLSNEDYKTLWDADHPDDLLEI
jgi:hypothetical protein